MYQSLIKYTEYLSSISGVESAVYHIPARTWAAGRHFCIQCGKCRYIHTHLYGCYEAERWDNHYIYYCPEGYVFVAVTIPEDLKITDYAVIAGPAAMGEQEDFPAELPVPLFSPEQVTALSETMGVLFSQLTDARPKQHRTELFLNDLNQMLNEDKLPTAYPIHLEQELQDAITQRDQPRASELVNLLLGQIFFHTSGDFNKIRIRILELAVLLSRAAIAGGADTELILSLNHSYIQELSRFDTFEKISVWLCGIIHKFISYVFEFPDIRHKDIIFKATEYIRQHYMKKISVREISEYVYLSPSYLCKTFKSEMNCTITEYINHIRIEKSKQLLSSSAASLVRIANAVGFEDQSYFTKVFKAGTGYTPKQYREKVL